ncbi:hypothetical protein C8R46DRAFT_1220046 [Mycena filopes]|nr:hypothetical protein C8R46DRAFT_1220046 [Mycena filopes]
MNDRAAISSLPSELLVAIIAAAQEEQFLNFPSQYAILDGYKPEWTMSQVSRRLRDVAIASPTLWSPLNVDVHLESSVEIFKLYLVRSQPCTIWINLRTSGILDDSLTAERLGPLIPHIARTRRLSIQSTPDSMLAMLVPFRDAEVPHLEHLELCMASPYSHTGPVEIFPLGAPNLTFLKLVRFTPHFPVPRWTASLTHLEIWNGQDVEDTEGSSFNASLATQCPSLVHLCISTPPVHAGRISIPSLKALCLDLDSQRGTFSLLDNLAILDVPRVTDLTVNWAHGDEISSLLHPASLPHRVFPAVTSLSFVSGSTIATLCRCDHENDEDVQWNLTGTLASLHPFPALSSLTLINVCFMPDIVDALLGPESPPWPLLETLTLCPLPRVLQDVYAAIRSAVRSMRQRGQVCPKFRFSPELCQVGQNYWAENEVDVESFDPTPLVGALVT